MMKAMKAKVVTLVAAVVAALVPVAALAQTTPTVDWAANATTVKDSVVEVIIAVLPIGVGLMALFLGIRVLKGMIKKFSGGG